MVLFYTKLWKKKQMITAYFLHTFQLNTVFMASINNWKRVKKCLIVTGQAKNGIDHWIDSRIGPVIFAILWTPFFSVAL